MKTLEGWQFAAARCAARWGYREVAKEAGVAVQTVVNIERMPLVHIAETAYKEKGKVAPDVVERLLAAFKRAGFRLVPATATRPARIEKIKSPRNLSEP
jgi:hypothetical protein